MLISLDYDDTITRDPEGWESFIDLMQLRGHKVFIVTMRNDSQLTDLLIKLSRKCKLIFTDLHAKKPFTLALGMHIDVWIDDSPNWIFTDALGAMPIEYNTESI